MNGPVVRKERVGDAVETLAGLDVVERDRLVRDVSAREHDRPCEVCREQVVERRVREHDAEPRRARRHGLGDTGAVPPVQQHDRPRARAQQRLLLRRDVAQLFRRRGHQRERLVVTVLARAQPRDGVFARRIAGEVVAAEPFHRDDRSVAQQGNGLLQRHRELRSAGGTGDRLGVEASIGRILVFPPAVGAHREAGHRRSCAVVGHGAHDGEARAALGAIQERIPVPAVGRVEELAQAVVARCDVCRNRRCIAHMGVGCLPAGRDCKALVAAEVE